MANKPMKRYSITLVIRKMKTPTPSVGEDIEPPTYSYTADEKAKMLQPLWKIVCWFLMRLNVYLL